MTAEWEATDFESCDAWDVREPLAKSVDKLSISSRRIPVPVKSAKPSQTDGPSPAVPLKKSSHSQDRTKTPKAERNEWDEPIQGAAPAGDWKMEVFEWSRKSEKRRQALDPDFQIEDKDPKKEKATFANSHNSGIRFDEMGKVPVTTQGANIPPPWETFETESLFWLIRENLKLCKFKQPTPVQKYAIPIITQRRDLMASAQTGSGKAAAFVIPIVGRRSIQRRTIDEDMLVTVHPLVLILEPTRELAIQIFDEVKKVGWFLDIRPRARPKPRLYLLQFGYRSWVRTRIVYGGVPIDQQIKHIKTKGVDLLIATPGRLQDLIDREFISLSKVRTLILDEADRMLDMGFEPHIRRLVETDMLTSAEGRQTLMFSATFPPNIERLAQTFQRDAVRLSVGRVGSVSSTIKQKLLYVERGDKDIAIVNLLKDLPPSSKNRTLIFVDTKNGADSLFELINTRLPRVQVAVIHGGKDQWAREAALDNFKAGKIGCLIATAVAARGLDIYDVAHVINYDIPKDDDEYVHRIGRTGRAGKEGSATSLFELQRDMWTIIRLIRRGAVTWDIVRRDLPSAVASDIKEQMERPDEGYGGSVRPYGDRGQAQGYGRGGGFRRESRNQGADGGVYQPPF
ncbi:DEAD-box ATP-dependent RNA helicase [Rhizophlyctis rosea]|uniref:RNA helicase n=1 Tax=Rhizophlyctis rosea TaxID=64517 RepID=A0AAD5SJ79_9FUNG|nr:DEAD-box ATP-dependent RNA helicase [Rhizophlyctis rosea]